MLKELHFIAYIEIPDRFQDKATAERILPHENWRKILTGKLKTFRVESIEIIPGPTCVHVIR